MKRCLYLLFLITLDSFCFIEISAHDLIVQGQDTTKSNNSNMWLNFGVGVLPDNKRMYLSPGLGVNFSFQSKIHLISGKLFYAEEFKIFGGPHDRLTSLDLMYGLIYKKPLAFISGVTARSRWKNKGKQSSTKTGQRSN